MNIEVLLQLARMVLPSSWLDYFEITSVTGNDEQIELSLDEIYYEEYKQDLNIESKGFTEPTTITDFPIRDHQVLLHVRRRRWNDLASGKSFCKPIKLTAEGTRYSKEFAAFLKDAHGEIPSDVPDAWSILPYQCKYL